MFFYRNFTAIPRRILYNKTKESGKPLKRSADRPTCGESKENADSAPESPTGTCANQFKGSRNVREKELEKLCDACGN
ncbi:MAG: hypothetical protein IKX19_00145 [Clostridia bacterium]|nr:hypothetical protein [Clostridia bacterium]